MKLNHIFLFLLILAVNMGCGQKGPLKIPEPINIYKTIGL